MTAQGSGNPFLEIAKAVDVNTNVWKGISSAGVTWSFQAEGSAVGDGSPVLAQPAVTVFMARGFIPYSIEVGMDYPSFAEEMSALLASGYDELLIDKFSRGSGSGEPLGILTALDADTNDEVRLTTAGAFGDIDVYAVWKALPQRFRRKASWMMSVGTNNGIRRMGTSSLSHAYTTNLVGETIDKLFNRQVYESVYFPDVVATTGSWNQLVVGDFSNYILARRGGMNVELVPTLFDITNNRPTGQRGWFAYARIGGGVANDQAFRLLNQT
jgi:HK97 family phage major capsid protein